MKTIYSMRWFYDEVKEIAKSAGKDYIFIKIEMNNDRSIDFMCYAEDYGLHSAPTMEGAIQSLRHKISPPIIPYIDVEVEVETEETSVQFNADL